MNIASNLQSFFHKNILSAYYVPVTVLRAGDMAINIKDGILAMKEYISMHIYISIIKHQYALKRTE